MLQLCLSGCCIYFYTHIISVCSKCFIYFKCIVAFECFMLQVQTAGAGVYEAGQGQSAATDMWRRRMLPPAVWGGGTGHAVLLWKRRGRVFQAAWKRRAPRRCGRGEGESSSSVGSGSEAGSDASTGNKAGTGGTRIQADRAEQPRASKRAVVNPSNKNPRDDTWNSYRRDDYPDGPASWCPIQGSPSGQAGPRRPLLA
jgi:hypothetical protein